MSELRNLRTLVAVLACSFTVSGPVLADKRGQLLDPTRPTGWQASEVGVSDRPGPNVNALRLQGTFSLAGQRSAMISGRRVTVGDEVGGARVIGIDKNKVTLHIDGELRELAYMVPAVKSPTTNQGDRK